MMAKKTLQDRRDERDALEKKENIKRWQREEALREAEVSYITDEQQRSVHWWWTNSYSEKTSLQNFLKRARQNEWEKHRDKYWRSVQQAVLRDSKNRAVRDRVKGLMEVQAVRADVLDLILAEEVDGQKLYKVQPSSYEGMVRAFVKVDEHLSAERDGILSMIEPELAGESAEQEMVFSHEELATMAKQLLTMRHAKQQKRLQAHADKVQDSDADDQD